MSQCENLQNLHSITGKMNHHLLMISFTFKLKKDYVIRTFHYLLIFLCENNLFINQNQLHNELLFNFKYNEMYISI